MTEKIDNIEVERRNLLQEQLPDHVTSAFSEAEAIHHEFGLSWLRNLAATALSPDESAWIYIARRGASDFAALPLLLNAKNRSAHALSTWYSSLWAPLARGEQPRPLFSAIFKSMAETGDLTSLTLSPMDRESPAFQDLQAALRDTAWKGIHTWPCFTNWVHPIAEDSYGAYLARLPSRVRNTIQRKTRRFLQAGAGELAIIEDVGKHPQAQREYLEVYANSWKPQEPFQAFIPGLLVTASERGWLRLGLARYQGKTVASQIWLVANGTAAIFKLAYHRDYASLSPGTVLTAHLMEHVINTDHVDTIDYLTGDDEYKQDWMTVQRQRSGIAGYNTATARGMTAWLLHGLKQLIKKTACR